MRRREGASPLVLRPVPPFRLDFTVWALRRRQRNLIDRWDGSRYQRAIVIEGRAIEMTVHQRGLATSPSVIVTANPPPRTLLERRRIRMAIDRLLGLRIDLIGWYRTAATDARLRPLTRTRGCCGRC